MSKLTEAAWGQECQLRIYPYCSGDPATTVCAHINCEDKGKALKSPDWWSVHACSTCHGIIDGHIKTDLPRHEIERCIMSALYRTLRWRIENDLATFAGYNHQPSKRVRNYATH